MDDHFPTRDGLAVDLDRPSAARIYDYLLGGGHNFAADRTVANALRQRVPHVEHAAQANRSFLRRAVLHLIDRGIRQFLDLGAGIPTVGNVHDIAYLHDPRCAVVYIDNDPIAVAHSHLLLKGLPTAAAVKADLRDVDKVLDHPTVQARIDFDRPVAVLLCAVLHFLHDDDDPAGIVARYVDRLAPGSFVAISHATADDHPDPVRRATDTYRDDGIALNARTKADVTALFTGLRLTTPGVVHTSQWRPETVHDIDDPTRCLGYAGVATLSPGPSWHTPQRTPVPSRKTTDSATTATTAAGDGLDRAAQHPPPLPGTQPVTRFPSPMPDTVLAPPAASPTIGDLRTPADHARQVPAGLATPGLPTHHPTTAVPDEAPADPCRLINGPAGITLAAVTTTAHRATTGSSPAPVRPSAATTQKTTGQPITGPTSRHPTTPARQCPAAGRSAR
ncbi:SAM-dependent methyltransferase [Umezawaea sp. Da 62-37]|uniref:SAM-dependent methyltransferase n=1 Tax=Umezawaea sp. Da 62-37 TaxID=3075927 RepID=UPI0028F71C36|nr:SAM-dependent methyltransferase [Umezawaea sp. Da 62-37]WNV85021.1 SAM-dependent methyltransferase [Umezawaea sp. Da 62-37]